MPSVLPSRWEEKVIFLEDFALPPCLLLLCVFVLDTCNYSMHR